MLQLFKWYPHPAPLHLTLLSQCQNEGPTGLPEGQAFGFLPQITAHLPLSSKSVSTLRGTGAFHFTVEVQILSALHLVPFIGALLFLKSGKGQALAQSSVEA